MLISEAEFSNTRAHRAKVLAHAATRLAACERLSNAGELARLFRAFLKVEEGRLRRDLYDRLSLIRIELPPMRQRREDIPFLANHFLKEICRANGAGRATTP